MKETVMNWHTTATKREAALAVLFLGLLLNVIFFPVLWGNKTLLTSSWDVPSVMPSGAYHPAPPSPPPFRIDRTLDAGAPAWQIEPWLKIISVQYWKEHELPLWNPYAAYGTPLAAAMQPQPFYPLTVLLSLYPSPRTYDFFIVARLFAAGILMFLFARLFLGLTSSLFAGITFMLSGYFIAFINMPHVSVEVLLPGLLLTLELLLRRNSWGAAVATAAVVFVAATGGMPESLFLILSFGCLYFLFRLVSTRKFRQRPFALCAKFVVAMLLGSALSAFLLLPFVEFMNVSFDSHQAVNTGGVKRGLQYDGDPRVIVTYLLPLIFGPVRNSIFNTPSGWSGMWGYWGVLPVVFALVALIGLFFPKWIDYRKPLRSLCVFFAIAATLILLKRFGNPAVNFIGELPVANLVAFPKYDEPLLALCLAMLAGIGFSFFAERRASVTYYFVSAFVALVVMLALAGWSLPRVIALKDYAFVYYLTVTAGILIVVGAISLFALSTSFVDRRRLSWVFLVFLSLELFLNFLAPSFYMFSTLPSRDRNPYAGAPYLDFLQAHNKGLYRIFGRQTVLFPNWAGVFGLADVRSLDAMYYRRYLIFVRSFLLKPEDEKRREGDLIDRFTGHEFLYAFDTDKEKRFLTLSSVKYVISTTEYNKSEVLNEILRQHQAEKIWGFNAEVFPVGSGRLSAGFLQHPPSNRIAYKAVIDPQRPIFEAIASIKTEAQDKTDGVGFKIEIKSDGVIEPLFSALLNPKEVADDRSGRKIRLDLSRYGEKQVELLFSTDPGPKGDSSYDWAGWADIRFVAADEAGFTEVYDREVYIYEVPNVLSRAALFHAAEVLPDDQVLSRLQDPASDIRKKVVLSQESLSGQDPAIIGALTAADGPPFSDARISLYTPQRVRVEASASGPAVLMLNDTNYPGWHAYVNGKLAPIIRADYLFRGVIVPGGTSTVEFVYEPASFRIGGGISIAAFMVALVIAVGSWRRRRTLIGPTEGPSGMSVEARSLR
jgi:hypothetical protein